MIVGLLLSTFLSTCLGIEPSDNQEEVALDDPSKEEKLKKDDDKQKQGQNQNQNLNKLLLQI